MPVCSEAFGEVAGTGDHLGGAAGDQQLARVRGHARGVGADLVGVAHPLQLHDQIHPILRQAGGMMRVRHQLLGQQHHGARRLGVHPRIAERAAAGFTAVTVGVAELIAGRHAEEGHVYLQLAGFDQVDPAAVRVNLHRLRQQAARNGVRQRAAQPGGVDAAHHAVADMLNQRRMAIGQRAGRQRQVAEPHRRQRLHHLIERQIAAAKRMVEGNGHTVLQSAAAHRFLQGVAQLEIARFARLQVGFGHVLIARQIPGLAKVINRCWRFIMLPPVLRRFFP